MKGDLSPSDLRFLIEVLSSKTSDPHLESLLNDEESLVEILDMESVFLEVIESTRALPLTPHFYFYILVRHVFVEAGIDDPQIADFVAMVLSDKLPRRPSETELNHAIDYLSCIGSARGRLKLHFQIEAGNQFLMMTGIFPKFIERRRERNGAPGLEFYENFARQVYRDASENRHATDTRKRHIFAELSDSMPSARKSLNRLSEEYVFLGN